MAAPAAPARWAAAAPWRWTCSGVSQGAASDWLVQPAIWSMFRVLLPHPISSTRPGPQIWSFSLRKANSPRTTKGSLAITFKELLFNPAPLACPWPPRCLASPHFFSFSRFDIVAWCLEPVSSPSIHMTRPLSLSLSLSLCLPSIEKTFWKHYSSTNNAMNGTFTLKNQWKSLRLSVNSLNLS